MRWDYLKPNPKSFIVDGKSLFIYQPENKSALVNPCFQQDGLTASVAFLWGNGRVDDQFDVSRFAGRFGDAKDEHLELIPKVPNSVFSKLILVLDAKTFRVKQSVVIDSQGNVNQFIFEKAKFNQGAKADTFAFAPPKDTVVTEMPTSCSGGPKR
jgi:outer membrane lipoprotein carrier protein